MGWYESIEIQAFEAWQWDADDQVKVLEILIALSKEGVEWSLSVDFGNNVILSLINRFDLCDREWLCKRNGQWIIMSHLEFIGKYKERT